MRLIGLCLVMSSCFDWPMPGDGLMFAFHACRGAPLPSIAQWISGLFGNVDLAPSDITAALVLAAAAQRRRRKNRIKKALNPIIKAASNAATSTTNDQVSDIDTASVDESEWLSCPFDPCRACCKPTIAVPVQYLSSPLSFLGTCASVASTSFKQFCCADMPCC